MIIPSDDQHLSVTHRLSEITESELFSTLVMDGSDEMFSVTTDWTTLDVEWWSSSKANKIDADSKDKTREV
jgi:hypothetical protein